MTPRRGTAISPLAPEIALDSRFNLGREAAAVANNCNTGSMLKGPEMIGSLHTAFRKIRQRVGRGDKRARLFDEAEWELYERVRDFTMTSPERVCALAKAVEYVARNDIEGAIVECGVWRGGSMMAVAYSLLAIGCTRYDLYFCPSSSSRRSAAMRSSFRCDSGSAIWQRSVSSSGIATWLEPPAVTPVTALALDSAQGPRPATVPKTSIAPCGEFRQRIG
ncbi:MAG: hypothetical protein KJZ87_07645 [Thermoguttaceae bacterium]|nr:hypothetical protein [Thermoguttaceae bacterium]